MKKDRRNMKFSNFISNYKREMLYFFDDNTHYRRSWGRSGFHQHEIMRQSLAFALFSTTRPINASSSPLLSFAPPLSRLHVVVVVGDSPWAKSPWRFVVLGGDSSRKAKKGTDDDEKRFFIETICDW
jgi:hypothetical protein